VADGKDTLVPKSYRIPVYQAEFVESLVKNKLFGTNNSDVVRTLLDRAIKELIETEYVRKHFETMELLRGAGSPRGDEPSPPQRR
jgi:Arc/MetJ-type ribon-helix-helix transcriptional regulator